MAQRDFRKRFLSLDTDVVKLYGQVTFGASGAVSDQDCRGFSVAKTGSENGRYTVTLEDRYYKFLGCNVVTEIAADTAHTATDGLITAVRNVDLASKTLDIQYIETDGNAADTNPASGYVAYIEITLKNSTLTY